MIYIDPLTANNFAVLVQFSSQDLSWGNMVYCPKMLLLKIYFYIFLFCFANKNACQVRVTVGDSGLCCCACSTSYERYLTPLCVDSAT